MTLGPLLDGLRGVGAVVMGDLMLDEYVFGRIERISPEAPVMVVQQTSTRAVPGGAANVAQNVRALRGTVSVVGVVGDDEAGGRLTAAFEATGANAVTVSEAGRITTRKTRIVADHSHQVLRVDHEVTRPVSPETEARLVEALARQMTGARVVILSDYQKGVLTPEVTRLAIATARERGVPVVANPKPKSLARYAGATLVSLNRAEMGQVTGEAPGTREEAERQADEVRRAHRFEAVLVTLGDEGLIVVGPSGTTVAPAPRVEVYDTAGAGDTVVATVALGLAAHGFDPGVFHLAAQTSARVVQHVGVAVPSPDDLEAVRAARIDPPLV